MALALVSCPTVCPQCGEDWAEAQPTGHEQRRPFVQPEFCPRCGSPVAVMLRNSYDPLARGLFVSAGNKSKALDRHARLVVRAGVLGMGLVGLLTGVSLVYGGWLDTQAPVQLDLVQLWVSRIGGPILLAQGAYYSWVPFRKPALLAKVLRFERK